MIKEAENKGNTIILILIHGHKFKKAIFLLDIFDIPRDNLTTANSNVFNPYLILFIF